MKTQDTIYIYERHFENPKSHALLTRLMGVELSVEKTCIAASAIVTRPVTKTGVSRPRGRSKGITLGLKYKSLTSPSLNSRNEALCDAYFRP